MNALDFLSNVLQDYCTLHDLPYISADDLLYEKLCITLWNSDVLCVTWIRKLLFEWHTFLCLFASLCVIIPDSLIISNPLTFLCFRDRMVAKITKESNIYHKDSMRFLTTIPHLFHTLSIIKSTIVEN